MTPGSTPAAGTAAPPLPHAIRRVRESRAEGPAPLYSHPEWAVAFPWLAQGTTGRGQATEPFDLGLFGESPVGPTLARWRALRESLDFPAAVHARQVHGADLVSHDAEPAPGLRITHGFDGHLTARAGLLLSVSVADCVPIFIVDAEARRVALLHGGWRGTAAGIVGRGIERMAGGDPARLHIHLGPAICGGCYEVGPEVHAALGLPVPTRNTPVDVRSVQAGQAIASGVSAERVTVSEHCTKCGSGFFSHRGGDAGRQMGVLGIRP